MCGLGVAVAVSHGLSESSARERIRMYLIEYVGIAIAGSELAVVSGISDYPRRVREGIPYFHRSLSGSQHGD